VVFSVSKRAFAIPFYGFTGYKFTDYSIFKSLFTKWRKGTRVGFGQFYQSALLALYAGGIVCGVVCN